MEIILHLGAHRTATTSFQKYMYKNADENLASGLIFWGPRQTRDNLLEEVIPARRRRFFLRRKFDKKQFEMACHRVAQGLEQARDKGVTQVVISDENMIGNPRRNLREARLYGSVSDRMAVYNRVFGGRVSRVVLSVRSLDHYWSSVMAYGVSRGHHLPQAKEVQKIVSGGRHWRDVITDLAVCMPETEIVVYPFEVFCGLPDAQLKLMTGRQDVPRDHTRLWSNPAPELPHLRQVLADRGRLNTNLPHGKGRWQPFNTEQNAILRDAYTADMNWLRSGADGMAILIEDTGPAREQTPPPIRPVPMTRG